MKKDRRRLVLNGSDDAYARREAVRDGGSVAEDSTRLDHEPTRVTAQLSPEPASRSERKPVPREGWPGEQGPVGSAPPIKKVGQAIQVNYRLNLGQDLSERLQHLAEAHDQSMELVMKGLRTRAAERFRILGSGTMKPFIAEPETGGKSIRYATLISGDVAVNLNAWFDPFGLGVAKDACKPILIGLFQEEARALCNGVELPSEEPPE